MGVLVGAFYGVLFIDEALKKTERGEYHYKNDETHEQFSSRQGYFLPTSTIKQGYEDSMYYGTSWYLNGGNKVNITNKIYYTYYTENKNEDGLYEYSYDQLNNGIYSIDIYVITNPIIIWKKEIHRARDMERNSPRHFALKYDFIKQKIGGVESMGYTYLMKERMFDEYAFSMYMESRISKDCHMNLGISWLIDINNYNYEELKQNAIDYVAYIIGNIQPPIY